MAADLENSIRGRRSIRKFKSDKVAEETIRDLLDQARWAPSWGNTQPWQVIVVSGEVLEKFKKANQKRLLEGVMPNPDIKMPQVWPDELKKRYMGIASSMFSALNIAREDKQARFQFTADLFGLFDAPCLILFCIDKSLSVEYACFDIGLFLQTFCLAAHGRGLGTCIMAASLSYPEILRELLPGTEEKLFVIGAALGYPDTDSPINKFERGRADVDQFVAWVK